MLCARYMLGSFQDEYGRLHASGRPPINITRWEVGNEVILFSCQTSILTSHILFQVDYEHGHTAATYTMEYDAIVSGIWKLADPYKRLSFRSSPIVKKTIKLGLCVVTIPYFQRPCAPEH